MLGFFFFSAEQISWDERSVITGHRGVTEVLLIDRAVCTKSAMVYGCSAVESAPSLTMRGSTGCSVIINTDRLAFQVYDPILYFFMYLFFLPISNVDFETQHYLNRLTFQYL